LGEFVGVFLHEGGGFLEEAAAFVRSSFFARAFEGGARGAYGGVVIFFGSGGNTADDLASGGIEAVDPFALGGIFPVRAEQHARWLAQKSLRSGEYWIRGHKQRLFQLYDSGKLWLIEIGIAAAHHGGSRKPDPLPNSGVAEIESADIHAELFEEGIGAVLKEGQELLELGGVEFSDVARKNFARDLLRLLETIVIERGVDAIEDSVSDLWGGLDSGGARVAGVGGNDAVGEDREGLVFVAGKAGQAQRSPRLAESLI
jgi:hypothetical protein